MTTATFNTPSHTAIGPLWLVGNVLKLGRKQWRTAFNIESDEAKAHRERFLKRQWQPIQPGSRQALRLNRMQDDGFAPTEDHPEFEFEDPHLARFTEKN